MFGYILPDKPNMYIKDYTLYRAFYCGICKCTGKMYGQLMRFSVNYDITFLSILIHNILNQDYEISNERCILNPLKKKSIVKSNGILKDAVYLNLLLADFKLADDIKDIKGVKQKLVRAALRRKVKKARKALPEIYQRTVIARKEQDCVEEFNNISIDGAAHPFASMMKDIIRIMCREKYNEYIGNLVYHLGRFVYFSDAIDDFDKDIRRNEYNPLKLLYKDVSSRVELINKHRDDMEFLLKSAYNEIRNNYRYCKSNILEGVVTNILWYGLDASISKMLSLEKSDSEKEKERLLNGI